MDVSSKIVMKLLGPYLNFGRRLYTDNWYSSVNLAESLNKNNTHLVGTLRANRKKTLWMLLVKNLKKAKSLHNKATAMLLS